MAGVLVAGAGVARAEEPEKKAEPEAKGHEDKGHDDKGHEDKGHEEKGHEHGEHGEHAEHGEHGHGEHGHGEHGKGGHEEHEEAEGRLPVSYTERPLTMPRHILNIEGELALEKIDVAKSIAMGLSARFGITDDLEVSAIFAPLAIGPFGTADSAGFHYENPQVAATYRFLRGHFELGATVGVTFVHATSDSPTAVPAPAVSSGVIVEPGAVFRAHFSKEALLEGGVYLPIEVGSVDPALMGANTSGVGLRVPLAFAYDLMEPLHIGVRSGLGIANFTPPTGGSVGDGFYVPLGIFAGYAVAGKDGPILDIDPFFTWNNLFLPGSAGDKVVAGDFSVGVSLGGFLYF